MTTQFDSSGFGSPDLLWFVVVGQTGSAEGSYGRDSAGVERPSWSASTPCTVPQQLGTVCP